MKERKTSKGKFISISNIHTYIPNIHTYILKREKNEQTRKTIFKTVELT